MKKMFLLIVICTIIFTTSCKKSPGISSMESLKLIQHKWSLVSNNGEALRYVGKPGDYYNFNIDNFLYRSINNSLDTFAYSLNSSANILSIASITNGIRSNEKISYNIKILDNNSFVFGNVTGVIFVLDSLAR